MPNHSAENLWRNGLSAGLEGGIWITDVEHGAVVRRAPGGALETWIKTPRIR